MTTVEILWLIKAVWQLWLFHSRSISYICQQRSTSIVRNCGYFLSRFNHKSMKQLFAGDQSSFDSCLTCLRFAYAFLFKALGVNACCQAKRNAYRSADVHYLPLNSTALCGSADCPTWVIFWNFFCVETFFVLQIITYLQRGVLTSGAQKRSVDSELTGRFRSYQTYRVP